MSVGKADWEQLEFTRSSDKKRNQFHRFQLILFKFSFVWSETVGGRSRDCRRKEPTLSAEGAETVGGRNRDCRRKEPRLSAEGAETVGGRNRDCRRMEPRLSAEGTETYTEQHKITM
ncbi:hypothetical protein PoB_003018400 [Plakobranchus ocellatus]|uniref:Uncharacterized protein n=1 Tax=Plakobranchus ocellatus TaxID=259542 RepID=A0AAV4A7N8_9GAST|nr:hypothetical protein PoB_003018400 [Plakobranchus ocellatus]